MTKIQQRFWNKVEMIPEHACWEWIGAKQGDNGYGVLRINGKNVLSHRISYEINNGPITDGLWVLHKCDNKACVRPDHLFLGTRSDNIKDMYAKGRGNRPNSRKIRCPKGHEYSKENTYFHVVSGRICKECKITNQRIRRGKA